MKLFVGISLILFLLFAFWYIPTSTAKESSPSDRIIVKFRSSSFKQKENLIKSFGLSKFENLKLKDTVLLQVPKKRSAEFISGFSKNSLVEYAEKDELAFALEVPNDIYYSNQWGLNKIQAPGGWDVSHGTASVKIAIADMGIDGGHPDLGAKFFEVASKYIWSEQLLAEPF